jgi:hypothetical protein
MKKIIILIIAILLLFFQASIIKSSNVSISEVNSNKFNLKSITANEIYENYSDSFSNNPYKIFLKENKLLSKRRILLPTKEEYQEKCYNHNSTEAIGYNSTITFSFPNITVHEFLISRDYYTDKYKSQLEKIIIEEDHSELRPLIGKIASPYIIFIIFAIITLIGWPTYWIIYWREILYNTNTQSRSETSEEPVKKNEFLVKCNNYSMIIMLISLLGILIASIIAWIYTANLSDKAKELNCANIRLVTDIAEGESKSTLPKWVGVKQLGIKLTLLAGSLDITKSNTANAFSSANITEIRSTQQDYYNSIDKLYNKYKDDKVSNPNPESVEQIIDNLVTPSYIQTLGPKEKSNSVAEAIKNDYDQFIYNSLALVDQLNKTTSLMNSQLVVGVNQIKIALQKIRVFAVDINEFDHDYLEPIRNFVRILI